MNDSFPLGRIFGIKVGVNWSVLLLLAFFIWTLSSSWFPDSNPGLSDNTYFVMAVVTAFGFFGSILLHELGHAVQATRDGMKIDGITLWLFGGVARFTGMFPTAGAEFRIAVAGPLVSLGLGAGFLGITRIPGLPEPIDGVCAYLGRHQHPAAALQPPAGPTPRRRAHPARGALAVEGRRVLGHPHRGGREPRPRDRADRARVRDVRLRRRPVQRDLARHHRLVRLPGRRRGGPDADPAPARAGRPGGRRAGARPGHGPGRAPAGPLRGADRVGPPPRGLSRRGGRPHRGPPGAAAPGRGRARRMARDPRGRPHDAAGAGARAAGGLRT